MPQGLFLSFLPRRLRFFSEARAAYHARVGRFLQSDPLPKVQARGEPGVYENSVFAADVFDGLLSQLGDFPDGAAALAYAAGVTRPYAYARNNPTGFVDPSGFFPWVACGKNMVAGIWDTMVESLTGLLSWSGEFSVRQGKLQVVK